MQAKLTNRPVEQVIAAIHTLDLDPIKLKLMGQEEGQGWTREYADRMELAYKRFLTLLATHPEETVAPSKDVDKFWHGHILDTLKYAEDCDKMFGNFLHHFPYFGMRGAEDAANLARAAENTRRLYLEEFGSVPNHDAIRSGISAKPESVSMCGAAIRTGDAAMCGAAIRAGDAAMCGAAIRAGDAAMCGAAIRAGDAAMCGAAVRTGDAAMCGAAIRAGDAAMCGAAVRAGDAAMCGAAVQLDSSVRAIPMPA
jgi:hypothetical protein